MPWRRALRFTPSVLLMFACDHADVVGRATGMNESDGGEMSGGNGAQGSGASVNGAGASTSSGSANEAGSAAAVGGSASSHGGAPNGDGGNDGSSGSPEMLPNTAGNSDGGAPSGDAGAGNTAGTAAGSGGTAAGGGGTGGGGTGGGGTGGGMPAVCNDNDVRPCYTGPADARGKGACSEGTQTCVAGEWNACSGDVQPIQEVCDDGSDNDCDGLSDDCGEQRCVVTMKTQNAGEYVWPWDVARDASGNALVTGQLWGTGDFGGKKATSVGGLDIFVAKYTANCELLWVKTWGSPKHDRGVAIAVADNGDFVLGGSAGWILKTGDTGSGIDLGGGMLADHGNGDAFLARYTADGVHIWSHLYGANSPDVFRDIALAANGDIVAVGGQSGDFGDGSDLATGGIVARYTGDGAHVWSTALHYGILNGINTQPGKVAIDGNDSVLVAGAYDGGMLRNGVATAGVNTAFLTSISGDGKKVNFAKTARTIYKQPTVNTADLNRADGVAARGTTAIYAGVCTPPIDFGGGKMDSQSGGWDAFVAGYDASGAHQFSFLDGSTKADMANDIALDRKGNIGLIGQAFPKGIVVKYSPDGRWLWSKAVDTYELTAAAFATDNSLAVAGHFDMTVDFGQGSQTPIGANDGVLLIYNP